MEVALYLSPNSRFRAPASTFSPGLTGTGIDSPVNADVSMLPIPSVTSPSTAAVRNAGKRSSSPRTMDSTGISTCSPPRMAITVAGLRRTKASIAPLVFAIVRSSKALLRENKNKRTAASAGRPSAIAPTAARIMRNSTSSFRARTVFHAAGTDSMAPSTIATYANQPNPGMKLRSKKISAPSASWI